MKKRVVISVGVLALLFFGWLYIVTPWERHDREEVNRQAFDVIGQSGSWDMRKPMLYGFFFTGRREAPLKILGFLLSIVGHRVVDISKDEEEEFYWLHVERIQIHTLDSISTKDVRLRRIGLICMSEYDGWDVGLDLVQTDSGNYK